MYHPYKTTLVRHLIQLLLFSLCSAVFSLPLRRALPPLPDYNEMLRHRRSGAPARDTAVFFTHHNTEQEWFDIEKWAIQKGLTHARAIWDIEGYADKNNYEDQGFYRESQFWTDFSKIYAQFSSGTVYLVMRYEYKPRFDSIFYSVELTELIDGGNVDRIIWIDGANLPDDPRSITKTYWQRGERLPSPDGNFCGPVPDQCVRAGPGINTGQWEWW
ncbi:hypothetical protein NM208_g4332 [Fusarium decemcellulare]|uniref:Uncharacterized protein n=1 Tax=Fusarium decemcellulare TaxID=57161 RepID=A0ACC1SL59_9HYPO|nr:hypothetical protein NM208_g4332 [Fusarium decemcellulare]